MKMRLHASLRTAAVSLQLMLCHESVCSRDHAVSTFVPTESTPINPREGCFLVLFVFNLLCKRVNFLSNEQSTKDK